MALRLMDFISENQVEEEKELYNGGPKVRDRVVINERPLFEILKDNKEKKDAELHEKLKHRPPKALDDDETEFLESVEMHKRELERQQKDEDAEQIINFQAALASRTVAAQEPRVFSQQQPEHQEVPPKNKRPPSARLVPISVKIKPVPKRMKSESVASNVQSTELLSQGTVVLGSHGDEVTEDGKSIGFLGTGPMGLVSYGETDDDED